MAKLIIRLKQNTSLLHFQVQQSGAFLRMTEVKARLDTFLLSESPEEFKSKKNLNYRLIVKSVEKLSRRQIESPLCLSSIGGKSNHKDNSVKCDYCELEFFSLDNKLIENIIVHLPKFFMLHNFGQRQSKGFGSFSIEENYVFNGKEKSYSKEDMKKITQDIFLLKETVQVTDKKEKSEDYLFKKIKEIYLKIRGNDGSYIVEYSGTRGICNAKEIIRDKLTKKKPKNKQLTNEHLIKDILGLASSEYWTKTDRGPLNLVKEHLNNVDEEKIERMQSPLIFKPVIEDGYYKIYIIFNEIPDEFWNQKFKIYDKDNLVKFIEIRTPKKEDFNYGQFIDYIKRELKSVKSKNTNNKRYEKQTFVKKNNVKK